MGVIRKKCPVVARCSNNKKLERELNRKEKALPETAALLVLSKKWEAIWGESEEDYFLAKNVRYLLFVIRMEFQLPQVVLWLLSI